MYGNDYLPELYLVFNFYVLFLKIASKAVVQIVNSDVKPDPLETER